MAHSFTLKLGAEISSVLKKVDSQIAEHGGRFEGNAQCGSFEGHSFLGLIKGKYSCISDTEISITIVEKPFLVPHSLIEHEIRKYLW